MGKVVLFIGGSRSGKSACAERYAVGLGDSVVYIATAAVGDDEMRERVGRHQARRPGAWRTVEAQTDVADALADVEQGAIVLLDSLTLLASNLLLAHEDEPEPLLQAEIDRLLAVAQEHDLQVIVVTDEVGMGVVPAYPLGRRYRDLLGLANQHLAAAAAEVYLVVAGIAVELRRLEAAFTGRPA